MSNNQADNSIEIEIKDENDLKEEPKEQESLPEHEETIEEESLNESTPEPDIKAPDYYDQYMRLQAEFQNYKRRSEQRMQEWRLYAAKDIVSQLLPVIDDFDILFNHNQENSDALCVDGVKMIYNKMLSTLQELGLEPIEAIGKEFDPTIHEAVMAEESDEVEEGHILKVWQQGFMYKDTLLRPSKVITAKAKQDGDSNGEQ